MFLDYVALWVILAGFALTAITLTALWGWLSKMFTRTIRNAPTTDALTDDALTDDGDDLPQEVLEQWSDSGNGLRCGGCLQYVMRCDCPPADLNDDGDWDDGDWDEEVPEYRGQEVLAIMMEEADEAWRALREAEDQKHQLVLVNIDPVTGLGELECSCGGSCDDLWLPF